jgi:hypothetical protein
VITVEYILADLPDREFDVQEDRGRVTITVARHLRPEEIIAGLNEMARQVLASGHWFQEWKGDIITIDSDDTGTVLGIPPQRPDLYDIKNRPQSGAA